MPITQNPLQSAVLIDDDELIHMSWKREGKKVNIEVSTYFSIEKFIENNHSYHKGTPIYIDSNLSNGIKGEIESERIKDLGLRELYLATGFSKDDINKPTWIKEVIGKSPAFHC